MRHVAGLTLIELLVAVSVFAIMATTGLPAMASFIASQHQLATKDALLEALRSARDEAQRRSTPIRLCPTANGTSCGSNWNQGWLVYIDKNNDGQFTAQDQRLKQKLNSQAAAISTTASSLLFRANGMTAQTQFNICTDNKQANAYQISVTSTGRVFAQEKSGVCS